ncbi:hypothetical protein AB0M43_15940 [Longispora sp. NPDC051575]|uniref:hypothetical protein n=1 Tax=Longispora sp. NPDC051575 TaxID=3154943 RepID=UPI00341CBA48
MSTWMTRGPIPESPLEVLFPGVAQDDVGRLRLAADALDAARPAADAPDWHWLEDHAVFPGPDGVGVPVILYTAVTLESRLSDWTELELDVCWTRSGQLAVTAQLGVGCWCPIDHSVHHVEQHVLLVDDTRSLADTFEQAVAQVIVWTAGPADPSIWRERAGLPSPAR